MYSIPTDRMKTDANKITVTNCTSGSDGEDSAIEPTQANRNDDDDGRNYDDDDDDDDSDDDNDDDDDDDDRDDDDNDRDDDSDDDDDNSSEYDDCNGHDHHHHYQLTLNHCMSWRYDMTRLSPSGDHSKQIARPSLQK